jgi:predicted GIY-YIG superfamily endonuclease
MAFLYILQSQSSGHYYIGSTNNLARRLSEPQRDHTPSMRNRGPWILVFPEEFPTLLGARRRERQIKSRKSARSVRELIEAKG